MRLLIPGDSSKQLERDQKLLRPRDASRPSPRRGWGESVGVNLRGELFAASDTLRCDGTHRHRAARAVDNLQWRGDDYGAGRWELIQVAQAGQAKLAAAVHDVVVRERRVKGSGPAGVRPNRLHADAQNVTLLG